MLELGDERAVAAERKVRLDPVLEHREPELLEPGGLGLRERLQRQIGEGRAPPQRKCGAERLRPGGGVADPQRGTTLLRELVEARQVELLGRHGEPVAGRHRLERALRQELPELRDVDLKRVLGRVGRAVAPQRVDQPVGRDGVVRFEEQDREEGTLLGTAELKLGALSAHPQRP